MGTCLFTIGFTKCSAEAFFGALEEAKIRLVIDVRLHPDSQLSGFAKRRDLQYLLRELIGADYEHRPILAPTEKLLHEYRAKTISWQIYRETYRKLLRQRKAERHFNSFRLDRACLLCSEALPERCHRAVAADYLSRRFGSIATIHLTPAAQESR